MTLPPIRHKGAPGRLTPTQRVELWAWVTARGHQGCRATYTPPRRVKAAELGLTVHGLDAAVRNLKRRAGAV